MIRILLVEDNPGDARLVEIALAEVRDGEGFDLARVETLAEAIARLARGRIDVVLLDLSLPDSQGLGGLARIQEADGAVPVVILTGLVDESSALAAMRDGAQDYLVKGALDGRALARSIRYAIERKLASLSSRDGSGRGGHPEIRRQLDILEAEHNLLMSLLGARAPPERPEPRIEEGALVAQRYRLERLLGEGTYGCAFLAWDESLARRVVLKALRPALASRDEQVRGFMKEARLAASLDHPNVVRIHDFGTAGSVPFIVMEYAEGGSLAARLETGPLDAREASRILGEVLAGLAHMHDRGVLHRDVKPANILLSADGRARIADFGLALADDPASTYVDLGGPDDARAGTPAYASPEAVLGAPFTPAGDVFSAGAVLYECLAGRPWFDVEGLDRSGLRRAILESKPRPLPAGVDAALAKVVLRALEKEPRRRFATAAEMVEAINAVTKR